MLRSCCTTGFSLPGSWRQTDAAEFELGGTRHCSDLEARSHFLLALGGAIRAAEEGSRAGCETLSQMNRRKGSTASHAATRLRILAGRVAGTALEVAVV